VGRKDVEDALLRLDMLTKEESFMMVVRNLDATHHIDGIVRDVDGNVKATMVLTEDINDNVKATKVHIHEVDNDIRATKVLIEENVKRIEGVAHSVDNGTQYFLSVFIHNRPVFLLCPDKVTYELKRLSLSILIVGCRVPRMTHAHREPDPRQASSMALSSRSLCQS
jgi:hypothetical protein